MKFNIFSVFEKWYKIVTIVLTIVVTVGTFFYYVELEDKSDSFVISIIYALFLFVVGLFVSHQSNAISNRIFERKDAYIMLLRLRDVFGAMKISSIDSDEDVRNAIITIQLFSGRCKVAESNDTDADKPKLGSGDKLKGIDYIRQIGFVFTSKFQKLENNYIDAYDKMLRGTSSQSQQVAAYKAKIVKEYRKCNKKILWNIDRMYSTYGDRLEFIIDTKEELIEELYNLRNELEGVSNSIELYKNDESEALEEYIEIIRGNSDDIREMEENIISSIEVEIEMLEEDLGLEFDVKEKYKTMAKRRIENSK